MHSIYLVRHGKSSLEGRDAERGLEPEGHMHASKIAERLASALPQVKIIYVSPFRRAQLTMEPLAKRLGLEMVVINDFREKSMSAEPIEDLKAARKTMWDDFGWRLPGGESNDEAQKRALKMLQKLRADHPDEAVAVGSHGTLIALVLNSFDPSFGYESWRNMPMPDIFRIDFINSESPIIDHIGCPVDNAFNVQG